MFWRAERKRLDATAIALSGSPFARRTSLGDDRCNVLIDSHLLK
jgi:hypothetical protein